MKTAVSIPDTLFERADTLANKLGLSRSELYARALLAFVEQRQEEHVTELLNRVHAPDGEVVDPVLAELQRRGLASEDW